MRQILKLPIIIYICLTNDGLAQVNLVPNPTFDYLENCSAGSILENAVLEPWIVTHSTPDFMHPCKVLRSVPQNIAGYQLPIAGDGYVGLYVYLRPYLKREYVSVQLLSPLEEEKKYFISFNVSLADSVWYATKSLGVFFSEHLPNDTLSSLLDLEPQVRYEDQDFLTDKEGWTRITGSFIANGGEEYITIGNFSNDDFTDTLFIPNGGILRPNAPDFWANSYYYIDSISVSLDTSHHVSVIEEGTVIFNLWPNPATEAITIETDGKPGKTVSLFDMTGREVLSSSIPFSKYTIDIRHLPTGIYTVRELLEDGREARQKVVIQH